MGPALEAGKQLGVGGTATEDVDPFLLSLMKSPTLLQTGYAWNSFLHQSHEP